MGHFVFLGLLLPNEENRNHEGPLRNTALGSMLFLINPTKDLVLFQKPQSKPRGCVLRGQAQKARVG